MNISSVTGRVAPDQLKAPAILSSTTLCRSAVEWEDLKLHWKSEKIQNSQKDQHGYYLKLFQRFSYPQKKDYQGGSLKAFHRWKVRTFNDEKAKFLMALLQKVMLVMGLQQQQLLY